MILLLYSLANKEHLSPPRRALPRARSIKMPQSIDLWVGAWNRVPAISAATLTINRHLDEAFRRVNSLDSRRKARH